MTGLPGPDPRPGSFGSGSLSELPRVAEHLGLHRILLLTGQASFTSSGAADVLSELRRVAEVVTWSDFSPNPDVRDLVKGSEIAAAFEPDGIIGIGGGSVLDMAKLVATLGRQSPEDILEAVRTNTVAGRAPALLLVPTTSGSGSEATHFAVAYVDSEKFSVAHPALLPDFVILDPDLTESASGYQKATSVIDAIAQAVESHWARGATPVSRRFAREALADLALSAAGHVAGHSPDATRAARGSHLAGRAIDLSKTTGAHALAYGFTTRHGISHGHAVALTLGAFARAHVAAAAAPGSSPELRQDLETIAEAIDAASVAQIGDQLDDLAAQLGLELRLRELGVPRDDLVAMAAEVNQERLSNNPVALSAAELTELLESRW